MPPQPSQPALGARRRGLSLIEVALASVVLAFIAVAAARTVVGARASDQLTADRAQARLLANALMAEVLLRDYKDPEGGLGFGIDAAETQATRSTLDDIDDFNSYNEDPVKNPDGLAIAGLSAWSRQVRVEWVTAANFTVTSAAETEIKRITVTVLRSGRRVLKAIGIRCVGRESVE